MRKREDLAAKLPDGTFFPFWEDETKYTKTLYVDRGNPAADDSNPGTQEKPFRSINAAAQVATAGTRVLVKGGTYRETVSPAHSGTGPDGMIMFEAASGEEVLVKASVLATEFTPSTDWRLNDPHDPAPKGAVVWQTKLNPADYMGYNPFCAVNIIHDRFYIEFDKTDMTTYLNRRGMVFLDGKPLKQAPSCDNIGEEAGCYWVEANGQTIHIRLPGDDSPEKHVIELTNREQCFAPETPFLSYIRVKGFTFAHAAGGAPIPQRGSVSTYRGHHWIIEDCTVNWSNGTGIDCGDECWHHTERPGQILGYHIIRGNDIRDVGVCGIAAFKSTNLLVEDNRIHGTGWQRMELSWEAGGIKVHQARSALFRRNVISHSIGCDAIWMDVANYNCRLTGNLLVDGISARELIFMECNKDEENLIDNNILWNVEGRYSPSKLPVEPGSTGWYKKAQLDVKNGYGIYMEGNDRTRIVNNLFGKCHDSGFFGKVVAFRFGMGRGGTTREQKFFNNLFYDCGEAAIKMPTANNHAEGNVYAKMPAGFLRIQYPEPTQCLNLATWQEFCGFDMTGAMGNIDISVDSDTLNMTIELRSGLPKVNADEKTDTDYFTETVSEKKRIAGPFPGLKQGKQTFSIDPRQYRKADVKG